MSILFGIALALLGERGERVLGAARVLTAIMFRIVHILMYAAPSGAFGGRGGGDRLRPIVLAATLSVLPTVPVAGMALILGVDRFRSECRSLTNFIGNAVATIVVSRWEGAVDLGRLKAAFAGAGGDFEEAESDALQIEGRSDVG